MTDPITFAQTHAQHLAPSYSQVAAAYAPNVQQAMNPSTPLRDEVEKKASDAKMARAIFQYNANLAETSVEIFAEALDSEATESSTPISDMMEKSTKAYSASLQGQTPSSHLGTQMNIQA